MKKQLLSLVIVAAFASNAYAADTKTVALVPEVVASSQSSTQSVDATPALNALDMQAAFQQDAQPMQVAALSGQEMKATEGAWGFFAIANFIWGATTNSPQDRRVSRILGFFL